MPEENKNNDAAQPKANSEAPQVVSINMNKDEIKKPAAKPSTVWSDVVPELKKEDKGGIAIKPPVATPEPAKPAEVKPAAAAKPESPAKIDLGAAPTPAPTATPTPTPAPAPKDEKPAEPEFFSSTALQDKSGVSSSKLMENISHQKSPKNKPSAEKILGSSAILQKGVEAEKMSKQKKKLRTMQFLFTVVALAAIVVNSYLYFQLAPGIKLLNITFGNNLTNQLALANNDLQSVKTQLNKYDYLTGQLYLNQFSIESAKFFDSAKTLELSGLSADRRQQIQDELDSSKEKLPQLLNGLKVSLTNPVEIETFQTRLDPENTAAAQKSKAETQLRAAIFAEKETYVKEAADGDINEADTKEVNFYDNAAKLVGNSALISGLDSVNIDQFEQDLDDYLTKGDVVQQEAFENYVDRLLLTAKSDLAIINEIKTNRVRWSKVMDGIARVTGSNDAQFNLDRSETIYTSYDFDSNNNRITVSGVNTTNSGNNRNVIATLIDTFEADPQFMNAANRSFPVSQTTDENDIEVYTMNFKMDLTIEDLDYSPSNTPVTTVTTPATSRQPAVRTQPEEELSPAASETVTEEQVAEPVVEPVAEEPEPLQEAPVAEPVQLPEPVISEERAAEIEAQLLEQLNLVDLPTPPQLDGGSTL